jgi:hypothetical protein
MSPRTTGILLLVAAALGAFVYLYEVEGEEGRKAAEDAEKRLFPDVEQDDVTSISLETSGGRTARLVRSDGAWRLAEPLDFPADAFAADGLASGLAGLASEAVLEDPQPPDEYGLGEGARVVRFTAGDVEHVLRIGSDTPIGSNAYAQVEGRDAIVTIPRFRASSFAKSLVDLRERSVLDFDRDAVWRIEARWPGASVELERIAADSADDAGEGADEPEGTASAWHLVAPVEGRADDDAVEELLASLSFLRADGFVDAPSEEQLAGFEEPDYEIVLHGAASGDAPAPSWRLAVGPQVEGDERLVRGAQPSLYTVPASTMADLPREVVAYRFKQLSEFPIADAQQVDFFFHPPAGDPVAVSAERTDEGWVSSPERLAPAVVARMVSELSDLEAGDILSEDASQEQLEAYGLAPPQTVVSVFGERPDAEAESEGEGEEHSGGAPRLAEIHIGNVEGSEWILARAAGDPAVYRLDYGLAEHLPVSLEAFRNRFLAEEEPPAPVDEPSPLEEVLTPSQESP